MRNALRNWWRQTKRQCQKHPWAAGCLLVGYVMLMAWGGYFFGYRHWQAAQEWNEAQRLLRVSQFDAARSELERCALVWSNDARTYFALAQTCRRLEDFEAASRYLEKAGKLHYPAEDLALESVLLDFQRTGGTDADFAFLKPYLDKHLPAEPLILETIVHVLHRQRQYRELGGWLKRWVTQYPDQWQARYYRASFYLETGRLDLAQQDFERVLEQQPDCVEARRGLGITLVRANVDAEKALTLLDACAAKRPNDHLTQILRARALRSLARHAEARDVLNRLLAQQVENASICLLMGQLELDDERPAEALRWLQRAEKLGTEDGQEISTLLGSLANVQRRLGHADEALAYQKKLERFNDGMREVNVGLDTLARQGADSEVSYRVAMLYLELGLVAEGVRWLEALIRTNPRDPRAYQGLIDHYAKQQDPEARRRADTYKRMLAQVAKSS